MTATLSRLLVTLAGRSLGARRRVWAEAMEAELDAAIAAAEASRSGGGALGARKSQYGTPSDGRWSMNQSAALRAPSRSSRRCVRRYAAVKPWIAHACPRAHAELSE